ncbi:uncharacterized protein EDB93DRAFT_1175358 [Suillus bovinus]|uniref:uncharacterized protein n=1 Tax=Suillus bovinus TaxID=48563 RepID=UPI001B87F0A9|nr:uncharacterized protein EDB93DRAFT_1175358 [Suillus bovinus]KAG2132913.1 hypothetical protein EDB93DRAFT_1175358 [Suillus bovinus]
MRFSILAVIIALTASVSVSACARLNEGCQTTADCCGDFYTCVPPLTFCNTHRECANTPLKGSCSLGHWHIATMNYIPAFAFMIPLFIVDSTCDVVRC